MTAPITPTPPAVSRVKRARLLHPCRFYAYSWMLMLAVALVLVAAMHGRWDYSASGIVALLLMIPGIEAAARSTVGPADVVRAYVKARQ